MFSIKTRQVTNLIKVLLKVINPIDLASNKYPANSLMTISRAAARTMASILPQQRGRDTSHLALYPFSWSLQQALYCNYKNVSWEGLQFAMTSLCAKILVCKCPHGITLTNWWTLATQGVLLCVSGHRTQDTGQRTQDTGHRTQDRG